MKRTLSAIAVLASLAGLAFADASAGYVYRDGYYWNGGVAYTRYRVDNPVTYYYANGYRYANPPTYYWKYVAAPVAPAYNVGWRSQHSAIAAARLKADSDARLLSVDHEAYLRSLKLLGLGAVGAPGSPGYNLFQGTTIYGHSPYGSYATVNSVAYSQQLPDLGVALAGSLRLAERMLQGSQDIAKNHQELVGLTGDQIARVAEYQAKMQLVESLGKASSVPGSVSVRSSSAAVAAPATPAGASAPAGASDVVAFKASINQSCIACHNAAKPSGNLSFADLTAVTDAQWDKVFERIYSSDPKLRMPKDAPALDVATKRLYRKVLAPGDAK